VKIHLKRSLILFGGTGCVLLMLAFGYFRFSRKPVVLDPRWGTVIDSYNDVKVYYNGSVATTNGRNKTADGYNLGLKYQCVEFVKRYYYEHLRHKMPDSYGNAKDFFDARVEDGGRNVPRGLRQYTNPSTTKPRVDDLVVLGPTEFNRFGHVAIVCDVQDNELTIIQQNPGATAPSRVSMNLKQTGGLWEILNPRVLGWLRKTTKSSATARLHLPSAALQSAHHGEPRCPGPVATVPGTASGVMTTLSRVSVALPVADPFPLAPFRQRGYRSRRESFRRLRTCQPGPSFLVPGEEGSGGDRNPRPDRP
jgi:surface antigen